MPVVEFFGPARMRAGQPAIVVSGRTARECLLAAEASVPALNGNLLTEQQALSAAYRLSLNGKTFLDDLERPLADDDALLVIAADPGG